jgi:dUTP pyrophosphatase
MAIRFEKVKRFADADFNLPVRKTKNSAGYDFEVAEDIVIPTWTSQLIALAKATPQPKEPYSLEELAALTKQTKAKPTLVSTGVKCHLEEGYYLELSVRSSTPLKYWIILANSVGIIDADYCDNPDNEGEIFFQVINMSPYPIQLRKGDIIGQGIIKKYEVTNDDLAEGLRTGGFGSTTGFKEIFNNLFSNESPVVTP